MSEYERGWLDAREECARVCDEIAAPHDEDARMGPFSNGYYSASVNCAAAIRALSVAPQETKWCSYCRANTHNDSECWSTRPANWKPEGIVDVSGILMSAAPNKFSAPNAPWVNWADRARQVEPAVAPSEVRVPVEGLCKGVWAVVRLLEGHPEIANWKEWDDLSYFVHENSRYCTEGNHEQAP